MHPGDRRSQAREEECERQDWRERVTVPRHLLVLFTRHLATLIQCGVPLVDCLECLSRQDESPNFSVVIYDLRDWVSQGGSLSKGVTRYPLAFPAIYAHMISVGESTGLLGVALSRLGEWLERDREITRKVKGAMIYPCAVTMMGLTLTLGMFYWVVPQFLAIFTALRAHLPLVTRAVLLLSWLARDPGVWLVGAATLAAVAFGLSQQWASQQGRVRLTRVLLAIPHVGRVIRCSSLARFASAAQMSLSTGVDLLRSLELAGKASQNALIMADAGALRESIAAGMSASEHMKQNPEPYDPILMQTMKMGEEAGRLDRALDRIVPFYEAEVHHLVEGLGALLEPIMLVGAGVMVAILLLSMFEPMYAAINSL